jgi:hypothetical protein
MKDLKKVPIDVVEALEQMFAENTHAGDTLGEVMYHAGERHVVRVLRETYERESKRHVLPKRSSPISGSTPHSSP